MCECTVAICRTGHEFYEGRKYRYPTLDKLLQVLKEERAVFKEADHQTNEGESGSDSALVEMDSSIFIQVCLSLHSSPLRCLSVIILFLLCMHSSPFMVMSVPAFIHILNIHNHPPCLTACHHCTHPHTPVSVCGLLHVTLCIPALTPILAHVVSPSVTCFGHTHACTLGPRPLRPPRGVVWDCSPYSVIGETSTFTATLLYTIVMRIWYYVICANWL